MKAVKSGSPDRTIKQISPFSRVFVQKIKVKKKV